MREFRSLQFFLMNFDVSLLDCLNFEDKEDIYFLLVANWFICPCILSSRACLTCLIRFCYPISVQDHSSYGIFYSSIHTGSLFEKKIKMAHWVWNPQTKISQIWKMSIHVTYGKIMGNMPFEIEIERETENDNGKMVLSHSREWCSW